MSFDSIPEDKENSFPCDCGGAITEKRDGSFECDSCDFKKIKLIDGEPNEARTLRPISRAWTLIGRAIRFASSPTWMK